MKELWVYLVNNLDELVPSIFWGMFQEIETTTVRASMKMERFFSENGTDVSRTIKTNHIGFF